MIFLRRAAIFADAGWFWFVASALALDEWCFFIDAWTKRIVH